MFVIHTNKAMFFGAGSTVSTALVTHQQSHPRERQEWFPALHDEIVSHIGDMYLACAGELESPCN